ncbi:MAG: EAL domain-containing protein [Anaerovoracaceae bacterium]|jgi:diguanylate cyclase (GGDEF)-like protein
MRKLRKSRSLRSKIILLMSLLVALQSLTFVVALASSRIFLALDGEAFRVFESNINIRAQNFNDKMGDLITNVAIENDRYINKVSNIARSNSINTRNIPKDEALYVETISAAAESVFSLLANNSITGAFIVLDDYMDGKMNSIHPGVYIRNSAPELKSTDPNQLSFEIGPSFLAKKHKVAFSVNWDISVELTQNERNQDFYHKPLEAVHQYPGAELLRYGYWKNSSDILNHKRDVITYSLPLIDLWGKAFGVMGVEISLPHFARHYLPNNDMPYNTAFYALTKSDDKAINLDWYIPSGPMARQYLQGEKNLKIKRVHGTNLYETALMGLGEMYCSLEPLQLYSKNSPFYDSAWSIVGFVSQGTLRAGSKDVRKILLISIGAITLVSIMAIVSLAYISTRKIAGLSNQIRSAKRDMEIEFNLTGLREIDDLTSEVEKLNRSIINSAKIPGKIMELTNMPMGCFEVSEDKPNVSITNYIYDLLGIPRGSNVTKEQWERYFDVMTSARSEENPDVFSYIHPVGQFHYWLRINKSDISAGTVGTIMDVSEEIENNIRLNRELDSDVLTGLNNRAAFNRKVQAAIRNHPDKIGAMIFIDLDNLKYVNDTYGHDVGDRYLIRAGEMLSRFNRHNGIVCRISGDEFAVFLYGYDSKEDLMEIIQGEVFFNQDTSIILPGGKEHIVRYSGGIAWYPDDSNTMPELLKFADYAMYEAKHRQKGTIGLFSIESYMKNVYILENSDAINELIDEEMIRFVFQPIVDTFTGEVYGYEALMRPTHESFSTPLEVLQVATTQFKLSRLERMIVKKLVKDLYENRFLFQGKKIFINSIPNQQLSEEDFKDLEKYSEIFPSIVVEFLERESAASENVQDKIDTIRSYGMSIAIDDFGAGFSNELQVLSLQPDIIKIDTKIIKDINKDNRRQDFVKNIVSFAKSWDIKVVAEGVETMEEYLYLKGLEVDYVQGYLFAYPDAELTEINNIQKFMYFADF